MPRNSAMKKVFYVVIFVLAILVVGIGILSVSDIAGGKIVDMAAGAVKEQTGLSLSVEKVKGNPIWGYSLAGVSLDRDEGQRQNIIKAGTLDVKINFMSLLRGSPRLSLMAVGGVNTNIDKLIEEISKIKFPESSGGGEVPIDRVSLVNSSFTFKWGSIDVESAGADINGTLMDADVSAAVNGVPVKGNIDADVQDKAVVVRKLDILVGKGRLTAAGNVSTGSGKNVSLDFQGALNGMDISDVTAFWPSLSPDDYAGNADLDFTVEGTASDILMTANLDFKGSKIGGYPLESLTSRFRYANMRISAEEVKATTLGIPIEGEFAMAMRTGSVPSIMIKLDGSGVPLSEAAKLYPGLGKVGGKIDRFAVDIHGPTDALSGVAELSAPDIVLVGKQIKNLAAQVKLAKGDTATVNGKFVLEGAQAYVQGTAKVNALTGADLNLTANLLNLDIKKIEDLIPEGRKYGLAGLLNADLTVKGKPAAPAIGGTLSSPKFTAEGYTLDKPSLSFIYENDTFTLKESSGSWSGLPIKASGTVGPLSSPTPNIAMTAQLSFSPETLKRFVPDADQYKLKGTISAGVKITGKLPQPSINLVASSQALSALDLVSAKNLEVTTALAGDLSKLDKIDLAFKAASIASGGVGLQNLSAAVRKDGQQVKLENVSAKSGEGSMTGGGTAVLGAAGADTRLDLAFDLNQLDLAPLAKSGGLGINLSGLLSGRVAVKGLSSNPDISFKGQIPSAAVEGMTLTGLTADISGNTQALKINDFRGSIGGAPLSAAGSVSLSEPFRADINVAGNGLDLASLVAGIPDLKGQVAGKADLKFNIKSAAGGNSGSGSILSPAVTIFGIKTSDLVFPLTLAGNTLKSENGTLNLYGGKVANTLVFDMKSMKFTDEINASGVDVNSLAQDATGGLGGKITGKGNLSRFKITGSMGKTLTYSGNGQFTMGEGSVTGFTGLNILSALYGVDGIRYTQVAAPLRLETGRLIIAKGASATPPANDPIYKSAKLAEEGTVTFDKKIYFVVDANVNFQLINVLVGGVAGGVGGLLEGGSVQNIFSGGNLESVLKGAITGGREQGQNADFREVTAKVTGTVDKPSVSLVKVAPAQQGKQQGGGEAASSAQPAIPVQAAPQAKPEDIIKEAIRDAIIPPKPEQPAQPAQPTQPAQEAQNAQPQPEPEPVEKQIEKRIEEEVLKGLGGLFKK